METTQEKRAPKRPHNVILEDRKSLTVTGVSDVDSFDDQNIVVYTDLGELTVRGGGLHIGKLNVETGELTLTGDVFALVYTNDKSRRGGWFGRLFK